MEHVILKTETTLESVKQWLCNMQTKGTPKYFEILIDGKRIVSKTDVLSEFDYYKKWINEFTQSLRVMVYNTENTHRAKIFEYRTENYVEGQSNKLYATRKRSLSEDEIEKRVQARFEEQKRNAKLAELTVENREIKKRLADAEAYIQKLEKQKDSFDLDGIIKMLLPGLQQHIIGTEQNSTNADELKGTETEQATASFRRKEPKKEPEQSEQDVLNDREKRDLELLRDGFVKMGEENYTKVMAMLGFLNIYPELIPPTHNSIMHVAEQMGWKV